MQRNDPNNNNNNSNISILPDEMLVSIINQMTFRDRYRHLPLVSTLFSQIAADVNLDKILVFIQSEKKQLTDLDKAFAKAIEKKEKTFDDVSLAQFICRNGIKNLKLKWTFLEYLENNYFILCRQFFTIPEVKSYLKPVILEIARFANCTSYIPSTFKLELLLISCLLGEVMQSSNPTYDFDRDFFSFAKLAPLGTYREPTQAAELYALCRNFVVSKHSEIKPELLKQFYNCYIDCLKKNASQPNFSLIRELVNEKLKFLQESEKQNQVGLTRN